MVSLSRLFVDDLTNARQSPLGLYIDLEQIAAVLFELPLWPASRRTLASLTSKEEMKAMHLRIVALSVFCLIAATALARSAENHWGDCPTPSDDFGSAFGEAMVLVVDGRLLNMPLFDSTTLLQSNLAMSMFGKCSAARYAKSASLEDTAAAYARRRFGLILRTVAHWNTRASHF